MVSFEPPHLTGLVGCRGLIQREHELKLENGWLRVNDRKPKVVLNNDHVRVTRSKYRLHAGITGVNVDRPWTAVMHHHDAFGQMLAEVLRLFRVDAHRPKFPIS